MAILGGMRPPATGGARALAPHPQAPASRAPLHPRGHFPAHRRLGAGTRRWVGGCWWNCEKWCSWWWWRSCSRGLSPSWRFLDSVTSARSWGCCWSCWASWEAWASSGCSRSSRWSRAGRRAGRAGRLRGRLARWLGRSSRLLAPLARSLREAGGSGLLSQVARYALAYSEKAALLVGYTVRQSSCSRCTSSRTRAASAAPSISSSHAYRLRMSGASSSTWRPSSAATSAGQVITSVCIAVFAFALLSVLRVPNALALWPRSRASRTCCPSSAGCWPPRQQHCGASSRGLPRRLSSSWPWCCTRSSRSRSSCRASTTRARPSRPSSWCSRCSSAAS